MLKFFVGGEQETGDDFLAVNLFTNEDAVSPEYVMEAIIDSLLGAQIFLQDNRGSYKGVFMDFSVDLPEGHEEQNYLNVPVILKNMEHKKLVDFYNEYCGKDCFDNARIDDGTAWYSFTITLVPEEVDEGNIWTYYNEYVV